MATNVSKWANNGSHKNRLNTGLFITTPAKQTIYPTLLLYVLNINCQISEKIDWKLVEEEVWR